MGRTDPRRQGENNEQNRRAIDQLDELSDAHLKRLREIAPDGAYGARYAEGRMPV